MEGGIESTFLGKRKKAGITHTLAQLPQAFRLAAGDVCGHLGLLDSSLLRPADRVGEQFPGRHFATDLDQPLHVGYGTPNRLTHPEVPRWVGGRGVEEKVDSIQGRADRVGILQTTRHEINGEPT